MYSNHNSLPPNTALTGCFATRTEPRQNAPGQVVGVAAFSGVFRQAGSFKVAFSRPVHQPSSPSPGRSPGVLRDG